MHTLVITFDLVDMTHERYTEVCAELAPAFAAIPGLLAKIWLADSRDARYGGVYLFDDTAAADGFLASTLAHSVATNPHFAGLTIRRFSVDEATTARTQPGMTVVTSSVPA
jgi:Putative mono-oxygenase ydhR